MIRNILLRHAGKYGCRAQTSADTVFAEAELLVRGEFAVCQWTRPLGLFVRSRTGPPTLKHVLFMASLDQGKDYCSGLFCVCVI